MRSAQRSPLQLKKHHEISGSMWEEAQNHCATQRNPEAQLKIKPDFHRKHERSPEVPVATLEEPQAWHRISRKTTRFPPQREMRPFSSEVPWEQSQVLSLNSKRGFTPFMQLKGFPEIPFTTRDELCVSRHNSRKVPCSPPHLEIRGDFHDSKQ